MKGAQRRLIKGIGVTTITHPHHPAGSGVKDAGRHVAIGLNLVAAATDNASSLIKHVYASSVGRHAQRLGGQGIEHIEPKVLYKSLVHQRVDKHTISCGKTRVGSGVDKVGVRVTRAHN